ncbi:MAG: hypothetical protein MJY71_02155 [Bacteroidaceae bacterium]|nr:hypothetical protein [Bacteroidaceae bacterium]
MDIIINNPFRVLGVYSNASAKDIVSNVNKAKAYIKVNKDISFDSDLTALLPPIKRTLESIDLAQAQINQITDRIKYALLWFAKESTLDDIAFGHLKANNVVKAKEIFSKKQSYSSLLNQAVLSLIGKDLPSAFGYYRTLIYEYRFRTDFIYSTCSGDKVKISEDELFHLLINCILEYHTSVEVINALESLADNNSADYVKQKIVSGHIATINSEISLAKSAESDAEAQLRAGKALAANTRESLQELNAISQDDDSYKMAIDNLAKQILQCGINYYNNSLDFDKAKKAFKLQNYALSIAIGKITKDRCQDNVNVLLKEIDSLPPESLKAEAAFINNKLNSFRSSQRDIHKAIQLIIDCAPYLARIKEEQGSSGKYYRSISTNIEEAALGVTISSVNAVLKELENSNEFDKYVTIRKVKDTLEEAWEVTQYMDVLELEENARERFDTQKQSLKNLLTQVGVSTYQSVSFKLETESEIFNRCRTKADYNLYISKFPNGKYYQTARNKVAEFERREKEEKDKLISSIKASTNFAEAILLYSKCKDRETQSLLDDICFNLCHSKSNFKKYLEVFGTRAKHSSEAESHLKFDRKMSKLGEWIKEHKGWIIFFSILITVMIGVGLIWGPSGYSGLCYTIAVISGFIAYGGLGSKDGSGCLIFIIAGIICALSVIGGNSIDEYYKDQIKNEEAEKVYKQLGHNPDEYDCASFVRKYPSSPHYNEVMNMYLRAAEKNGLSSLNKFAVTFGISNEFGKRAKERVSQICDSLYTIANNEGTIEGWREYINAVPSDYIKDAKEKQEQIENLAWNTDSKAWQQATKANTLSSYQRYLALYPNGAHHTEADKKVIDMQVANIYAGEHGELPAMDRTGYGGGYTSSIEIKNSTSYILTLLYSGPDSKRVVISPGQTSYVSLKNGTYRVAASVTASSVRSFAGTENLTGGGYSVEYYIVTSRY